MPHASGLRSGSAPGERTGAGQFTSCASATAAARLPTPSGPANIRLGGSDPRAAAAATRSRRCRWPTRSRNGNVSHRLARRSSAFLALFLFLPFLFLLLVVVSCLYRRHETRSRASSSVPRPGVPWQLRQRRPSVWQARPRWRRPAANRHPRQRPERPRPCRKCRPDDP